MIVVLESPIRSSQIPVDGVDKEQKKMTKLYVLNGPDEGKTIGLKDGGTYIGRAPECDLRLEDRTVSRRHLIITNRDREYFVTDLNSQNGTLYDGAVLPAGVVVPIKEGEPIAVGMTIIGLGEKCSERIAPVFGSVGITTEITVESGIFQAHRNKTNQKKLELLYKVSKLQDKNLPVNETLEKMLDYILGLLKNVDTAAFILVEPGSDRVLDVISKMTESVDDRSTVYCPKVVRQAIEERRPLVVSDVEAEEEVDVISTLKIQKIQSVLCVPLISHPYIMGVIYVDSRRGAFEFSKGDIHLFEDLSKRTAPFLVKAQWAFESTALAFGLHPNIPSLS